MTITINADWGDNPRDTRLKVEIFMKKGVARIHKREGEPLDVPFADLLNRDPEYTGDAKYVANCMFHACREAKLANSEEDIRFVVHRD
jgi:hypothetical protein